LFDRGVELLLDVLQLGLETLQSLTGTTLPADVARPPSGSLSDDAIVLIADDLGMTPEIVGLDEKVLWDDDGKAVLSAPGKDSVLIVDLADPENPKIAATLPLENSVVGPPDRRDIWL